LLALVGSTGDNYVSGLEEFLKQHNHVWSGWTYRILPRDEPDLKELKKKKDTSTCIYITLKVEAEAEISKLLQ
jgi:hypothetical protein